MRVAVFTLVTDTDERITGDLWAKGRNSSTPRSSVLLRPRTGPPVSVWIHAGKTRPRLEITKLPNGIRSVDIATVGRGRDVIRVTAPCRNQQRYEASSTTVRFGDGRPSRTFRRSGGPTCGDGVPVVR